jgi:hypothetical protein
MPDTRLENEKRRLEAAASEAHEVAEKALHEHAVHSQRARSYFDDAEAKQSLSPAEIERGRAEIEAAEREIRAAVRQALASVAAQTEEAISALVSRPD